MLVPVAAVVEAVGGVADADGFAFGIPGPALK
jgi:hypothetical protein